MDPGELLSVRPPETGRIAPERLAFPPAAPLSNALLRDRHVDCAPSQ